MTPCSSSTLSVSRCCTSVDRARGIVPCSASPIANSRWMTWSQVAGDPVAIGARRVRASALAGGQLPGQGGLVGEGGQHVQLLGGEQLGTAAPNDHHHTGDGVGGARFGSTRAGPPPGVPPRVSSMASKRRGRDRRTPCRSRCRPLIGRDGGSAAPAVSTTISSSTSAAGSSLSPGTATSTASAPVRASALVGDEPEHLRRVGAAQQFGADVAGGLDPGLPGGTPRTGRCRSRSRRAASALDQHLVVLAERLPVGLVGEVEVAVDLVADAYRRSRKVRIGDDSAGSRPTPDAA